MIVSLSKQNNGSEFVRKELNRMIKFLDQEDQLSDIERDDFTIKRNILNRILALLAIGEKNYPPGAREL
jgi:hypothetical protein